MISKNQKKRYTKIENDVVPFKKNKKQIKLKNWQKILLLSVLTIICIGIIVALTYLIVK